MGNCLRVALPVVWRAAEEAKEHMERQAARQQALAAAYSAIVEEVSNALQATSAANRSTLYPPFLRTPLCRTHASCLFWLLPLVTAQNP